MASKNCPDVFDRQFTTASASASGKKFTAGKILYIFLIKIATTGEAFSHQMRTSSTSKHEISELTYVFVGQFCPPGSGTESIDLTKSGSNPDPEDWRLVRKQV